MAGSELIPQGIQEMDIDILSCMPRDPTIDIASKYLRKRLEKKYVGHTPSQLAGKMIQSLKRMTEYEPPLVRQERGNGTCKGSNRYGITQAGIDLVSSFEHQ